MKAISLSRRILDSNSSCLSSNTSKKSSNLIQGNRSPPLSSCSEMIRVAASGIVGNPYLASSFSVSVLPEYDEPVRTYFWVIIDIKGLTLIIVNIEVQSHPLLEEYNCQ